MKILNKFFFKFYLKIKSILGYKYQKWCLALINEDNLSIKKIFSPPKNEFWADPFYFKYKKKDYCFFEKYDFTLKKGEICCAEIKKNNLINFRTVLKKKYHLSFPNIFQYKNNIYLMPETYQNKRLEIYICNKFPNKWSLFSTAFENEITCDPLLLLKNKKLWLFINKSKKNLLDLNKKLYIYQINNLKLNKIIPHINNPVKSSFNGGRNAAQQMFRNSKMIRISQNCKNLYGESINISKIDKLSLSSYKETKIKEIGPKIFKDKNIIGIHSWSKYKNMYLVDILYKFKK